MSQRHNIRATKKRKTKRGQINKFLVFLHIKKNCEWDIRHLERIEKPTSYVGERFRLLLWLWQTAKALHKLRISIKNKKK